jgi:hypothetical protein
LEALVEPGLGDVQGARAPRALGARLLEPGVDLVLELVEAQVQMFRLALLGRRAVDLALGVDQPTCSAALTSRISALLLLIGLEGVETGAAGVALVTSCARGMADGALALDETIGQEGVVRLEGAEGLACLALLDEAVVPEVLEDLLDDGGVVCGRGSVENVKVDAEPVVDAAVQGVVLGAERGRVDALLEGLGLGRGAVFVLSRGQLAFV